MIYSNAGTFFNMYINHVNLTPTNSYRQAVKQLINKDCLNYEGYMKSGYPDVQNRLGLRE